MLFSTEPGTQGDYPCLMSRVTDAPRGLVAFPGKTRADGGHRCYAFILTGLQLFFRVSSHLDPTHRILDVSTLGELTIPDVTMGEAPGFKGIRRIVRAVGPLPAKLQ